MTGTMICTYVRLRRVKPINRISTVTNYELVYVRFNWFLQNDIFTCVN